MVIFYSWLIFIPVLTAFRMLILKILEFFLCISMSVVKVSMCLELHVGVNVPDSIFFSYEGLV